MNTPNGAQKKTNRNRRQTGGRPKKSAARQDHFHGILLVDKPSGPTSHDVVARIRHKFNFKKVGHGGTLDPIATGLLVILLGRKGTKLSSWIMGSDKVYEGTMHLGIATNTQDIEGRVIAEKDPARITREQIEKEFADWQGDIQQIPPMVSAVKMNGVPLYKIARKDQEIEREPRLRHIYSFSLLEFDSPLASFRLKCSKGTYVRTLCADIGENLGCGAHLRALKRTQSGVLKLQDAYGLDAILKMRLEELEKAVLPVSFVR